MVAQRHRNSGPKVIGNRPAEYMGVGGTPP
jgi:hypothetical protein